MSGTTDVREVQISNWRPRESGSLRGFFSIVLPSGMIIHDCQLLAKDDRRWFNLPARQYESQGERKYAPTVAFTDREGEDRFRHQVLGALNRYFTETQE